jgi:Glycosyltransferase family 87
MDQTQARAWPALDIRASLAIPLSRLIRTRLAMDAVIVAGIVLVVFRLLNLFPWNFPELDFHAYWESRDVINYGAYSPFLIGAFLYSPAFAHVIAPLTALSWPVFAAAWTAILIATYVWLTGRWALPLLLSVAVALEIYLGQIDILIAAAIVIGFRYPAAWAFPLLTKVAPGVGLLWFVFRREWRNLLIALAATAAVAAVSAVLAPTLWKGWIDLLVRTITDHETVTGTYLSMPVWLRLPAAVALVWWGARTNRMWTVPVAAFLAMPILWLNVFTILLGAVPLLPSAGRTPARAWLLAGARSAGARPRLSGLIARRGARWPAT